MVIDDLSVVELFVEAGYEPIPELDVPLEDQAALLKAGDRLWIWLDIGLQDLIRSASDSRTFIDMKVWQARYSGVCRVCLAGSVMRWANLPSCFGGGLACSPADLSDQHDRDWCRILNLARCGYTLNPGLSGDAANFLSTRQELEIAVKNFYVRHSTESWPEFRDPRLVSFNSLDGDERLAAARAESIRWIKLMIELRDYCRKLDV